MDDNVCRAARMETAKALTANVCMTIHIAWVDS